MTQETHYNGEGLTAEVEAFNAYKFHIERLARLTDEQYVAYDKLVREFNATRQRSVKDRIRELGPTDPTFMGIGDYIMPDDHPAWPG